MQMLMKISRKSEASLSFSFENTVAEGINFEAGQSSAPRWTSFIYANW